MKRSVASSQRSVAMLVGFGLLVAHQVVACGDSSSSPDTTTASNMPGGQNNGSSSSNGGGNSTGATPSVEGGAVNIPLDPGRDPSVPINLVESGAVQCGGAGNYCLPPNSTCCITAGMGMGQGNTFSCATSQAACPTGTTATQACSNAASCGSGQVCCRAGGGGGMGGGMATSTCEASCPMGTVQVCTDDAECGDGNQCNGNGTCGPVACTATSCGTGQLCCRNQGGGGGNVAACVAPGADGLCPNNQRQVCTSDADCPATFTCTPLGGGGGGGGGVQLCQPPPCTITSCTGGQVCCVGGQVGGTPTCAAPGMTGACPGNSRLLCETDTECAPSPGTLCLLNPNNGMGPLSCRMPPPPPGDAGVDAGG